MKSRSYMIFPAATVLVCSAFAQLPTIDRQPFDLTVVPGSRAGFVVEASSDSPVDYQWYHQGSAIPGAESSIVLISDAQPDDEGSYYVRISNAVGSVDSTPARLSVVPYTSIEDPTFEAIPVVYSESSAENYGATADSPTGGHILVLPSTVSSANGPTQVLRFDESGNLDPAYPAVILPVSFEQISAVAIDPAEMILVTGTVTNPSQQLAYLVKVNSSTNSAEVRPAVFLGPDETVADLLALGADKWLVASDAGSSGRLSVFERGERTFSESFTTRFAPRIDPLQRDENGRVWVGADQLYTFEESSGLAPQAGPQNYTLIPGGGFYGVEWNSTRSSPGPYVRVSYTFQKYLADGTNDPTFSPFEYVDNNQLRADSLDLVALPEGGLWIRLPRAFSPMVKEIGNDRFLQRSYAIRLDSGGKLDPGFLAEQPIRDMLFVSPDREWAVIGGERNDGSSDKELRRIFIDREGGITPPAILQISPDTTRALAGSDLVIDLTLVGTGPVQVQNFEFAGEQPHLTLHNLQNSAVSITATNAGGYHRVSTEIEVVPSPPRIISAVDRLVVEPGRVVSFPVKAVGSLSLDYAVYKNGKPYGSGYSGDLKLGFATPELAGRYEIRIANDLGEVRHFIDLRVEPISRLSNMSVRAMTGNGADSLIAGFVLAGGTYKELLFRGIGPTLGSRFGLQGRTLLDPQSTLIDRFGSVLQFADHKDPSVFHHHRAEQLGAFVPLATTEPSFFQNIPADLYRFEVSAADETPGIALAEIYDADDGSARLINLSARAKVGPGEPQVVAGFVVSGERPLPLLVRGIGPTLGQFGVPNPLADPWLILTSVSTGMVIASNDDWGGDFDITAAAVRLGAFPLDGSSADAVLLVTLPPGVYVATLRGHENSTGIGLVEVYDASEF